MMTCREAAQLISESMDRKLPWGERAALAWHLFLCKFCTRYRRQLRFLGEVMCRYAEKAEQGALLPGLTLPAEARERMKDLLHH